MTQTNFYATGRRKRSIARVWIFPGQKGIAINGQDAGEYLQRINLRVIVEQPLKAAQLMDQLRVRARVHGGGKAGQAGAVRMGIARALSLYEGKFHSLMRQSGFLTRDPREKERKKCGRKGARRRFQYTKR